MIEFEVIGEVKAKGRPRFRNMGKFVKTYTDEKTVNYENLVKLSFINSGCEPYLNGEPLECEINIYKSIPKSVSKKKQQEMLLGKIRPTTKPDLDNCIKSILDGLNKVAFKDDSQIVHIQCSKHYSNNPYVRILIKEAKHE